MPFEPTIVRATVVLALAWLAGRVFCRDPAARFRLWAWTMASLLMLPLMPVAWQEPRVAVDWTAMRGLWSWRDDPVALLGAPRPIELVDVLQWLWGAGVLVAAARLLHGGWQVARLVRAAVPAPAAVRELVPVGPTRMPRVLTSDEVRAPFCTGIRRPTIVLPRAATGWPESVLRSVLLHESIHLERRDPALLLVQRLAAIVYWFHPAMWWAQCDMSAARERACDDLVLGRGVAPADYAEALVRAREHGLGRSVPALSIGGGFVDRVTRVLERRPHRRVAKARAAGPLLSVLALLLAITGPTRLFEPGLLMHRVAGDTESWLKRWRIEEGWASLSVTGTVELDADGAVTGVSAGGRVECVVVTPERELRLTIEPETGDGVRYSGDRDRIGPILARNRALIKREQSRSKAMLDRYRALDEQSVPAGSRVFAADVDWPARLAELRRTPSARQRSDRLKRTVPAIVFGGEAFEHLDEVVELAADLHPRDRDVIFAAVAPLVGGDSRLRSKLFEGGRGPASQRD